MARARMTTIVRRRLYAFARRLARPFHDSRRRAFLQDMVCGLVTAPTPTSGWRRATASSRPTPAPAGKPRGHPTTTAGARAAGASVLGGKGESRRGALGPPGAAARGEARRRNEGTK